MSHGISVIQTDGTSSNVPEDVIADVFGILNGELLAITSSVPRQIDRAAIEAMMKQPPPPPPKVEYHKRPIINLEHRPQRNSKCRCGSGRKTKHCCGTGRARG